MGKSKYTGRVCQRVQSTSGRRIRKYTLRISKTKIAYIFKCCYFLLQNVHFSTLQVWKYLFNYEPLFLFNFFFLYFWYFWLLDNFFLFNDFSFSKILYTLCNWLVPILWPIFKQSTWSMTLFSYDYPNDLSTTDWYIYRHNW